MVNMVTYFIMTLVFVPTFLAVQDQRACLSAPCSNGGFCVNTGNNYRCECTRGYYGGQCEHGIFCFYCCCFPCVLVKPFKPLMCSKF